MSVEPHLGQVTLFCTEGVDAGWVDLNWASLSWNSIGSFSFRAWRRPKLLSTIGWAAETAQSKIDELNNSYKSHADLVDEVGDRYAELSQRVNKNTNANIDLSADDYAEFLDINKRLAVCLISYDKESVNL